jgi:alkylhydroperoxidase family enzyme
MTRIAPVTAPYDDVAGPLLASMMPAGVEPIGLFRTFVRNPTMSEAMLRWGAYELSRELSIPLRAREIVIDRTTARCGCEYEWGVHVAFFAERAGFDDAQLASLTHGSADDACWTDPGERALIAVVDELHDRSTVTDARWAALAGHLEPAQLLDVVLLAGWYHAVSYAANAAAVALEPGTPRFADHAPIAAVDAAGPRSPVGA